MFKASNITDATPGSEVIVPPLQKKGWVTYLAIAAGTLDIPLFFVTSIKKTTHFAVQAGFDVNPRITNIAASLSLVVIACSLLFSPRKRRISLALVAVSSSVLLIGDLAYHRFYGDILSIPVVHNAWQLPTVTDSVTALLKKRDLYFIIDTPAWLLLAFLPHRRLGGFQLRLFPGIVTSTIMCLLSVLLQRHYCLVADVRIDPREASPSSPLFIAEEIGIFPFHISDAYFSVMDVIDKKPPSRQEVKSWGDHFDQPSMTKRFNEIPYGICRGKNVIFLQVESLQHFVIGASINGRPIAPNLSQLTQRGLYFSNCFDQTGGGMSSDANLMVLNSLYPARRGAFVYQYDDNTLHAIPSILGQHGYGSIVCCAFDPDFWNIQKVHRNYGFSHEMFLKDFVLDEQLGLGLSDRSMLLQAIPRLKAMKQPFFSLLITLTSHHPWSGSYKERKLQLGGIEGTLAGEYLHSIHYTDECIGAFLESLEKSGLLSSTIVVIYGDHQALPIEDVEMLNNNGFTIPLHTRNRVPLLFLGEGIPAGFDVSEVVGHMDLAPALCWLLGLSKKSAFLGHNPFVVGDRLVVFRNGGFATDKHVFVTPDGTFKNGILYDLAGSMIPQELATEDFERAARELQISDAIHQWDLVESVRNEIPELESDTGSTKVRQDNAPVSER